MLRMPKHVHRSLTWLWSGPVDATARLSAALPWSAVVPYRWVAASRGQSASGQEGRLDHGAELWALHTSLQTEITPEVIHLNTVKYLKHPVRLFRHSGGSDSLPGQSMWNLWLTWWERILPPPQLFGFPHIKSFYRCFIHVRLSYTFREDNSPQNENKKVTCPHHENPWEGGGGGGANTALKVFIFCRTHLQLPSGRRQGPTGLLPVTVPADKG